MAGRVGCERSYGCWEINTGKLGIDSQIASSKFPYNPISDDTLNEQRKYIIFTKCFLKGNADIS